jgi:hypothetical protein
VESYHILERVSRLAQGITQNPIIKDTIIYIFVEGWMEAVNTRLANSREINRNLAAKASHKERTS